MGDLGNYASKFDVNSRSLSEFDAALRSIRGKKELTQATEKETIDKLLKVISPISESIKGNLNESIIINEHIVAETIKARHSREWPTYREEIQHLETKLKSVKFTLSQSEFQLLNDIADALDAECANLFRRMSERR
jgi:molybdopterin converting factor small subunit